MTEPEEVERPEPETWEGRHRRERRQDRAILLSWGLGLLMIAGLGYFWIWHNQREQDRAMCTMLSLFTSGPPPVAGPEGDRGRVILVAMEAYKKTIGCDHFEPRLPTSPK